MQNINTDIELAYAVLRPREDHPLLEGLYEALFDETRTKFFAFTYMPVNREKYDEISYYFGKFNHYGSYADTEKQKKYIDDNSWQLKPAEECIDEGIFTHYAISFIGMQYEGNWYIRKGLSYFGDNIDEPTAKKILKLHGHEVDWWNTYYFIPKKLQVLPGELKYRDVEDEEFETLPCIVAENLKEKKSDINRTFRKYINEEIFFPFSKKLRIENPKKYELFHFIFTEEFDLVYPAHKRYIMMIVPFMDAAKKNWLEYFVYRIADQKIYQWTFFTENILEVGHEYREVAIKGLSKISDWNDTRFINSSRTMDDEIFWQNYVFKTENGNFIYLREVLF